jgi:hypothetical protein
MLTLYTLVEICMARTPRIRPRIKSLQKILYPSCLVTGCIGIIMGVDLRGAFGIYRNYPKFPRVTLEVMGIIPTICWGNVWLQQLCQSVFKASEYEGPFRIGQRPLLQKFVLMFTMLFWILALLISCGLMIYFNEMKYALVLWSMGMVEWLMIQTITWKCLSIMNASEAQSSMSMLILRKRDSSKNLFQDIRDRFRALPDRDRMIMKLRSSQLLGVGILVFCALACAYHSTLGWKETMDPVTEADPDNFVFSPIVVLGGGIIALVDISSLICLGFSLGCSSPADDILRTPNSGRMSGNSGGERDRLQCSN